MAWWWTNWWKFKDYSPWRWKRNLVIMVNNIPMRLQKCDFTCIFYGFRTLGDANEIMDWLSNQSKTLTILWWAHVIECRFDIFFVVPNKIFVKNWYKLRLWENLCKLDSSMIMKGEKFFHRAFCPYSLYITGANLHVKSRRIFRLS